jgi:CelD/BcsL family acetyltransferase involved in cellulose biosynthesis
MHFPQSGSDQEAVLATKDRKLRNQLRRGMKKLAVEGGYRLVNVRSEASEAEIRAAVQAFYDLERGGWKGKAGTAIACDTKTIAFYDAIAREARHFDYLSIFLLEAGGRPVAGNFGFAWRDRYYYQKTAYDEVFRQASPGNVLILELLCHGAELGLKEFDFLGVSQDYKERWTSLARSQAAYFLFRNNAGGRLTRTLMFEIGPRLKDRFPRSPLLDRIRKFFE